MDDLNSVVAATALTLSLTTTRALLEAGLLSPQASRTALRACRALATELESLNPDRSAEDRGMKDMLDLIAALDRRTSD